MNLVLALAAFLITLAEAGVSVAYTAAVVDSKRWAERQAQMRPCREFDVVLDWRQQKASLKAAGLEALFQGLLLADVYLIVDRWWLGGPVMLGGFLGVYLITRRK